MTRSKNRVRHRLLPPPASPRSRLNLKSVQGQSPAGGAPVVSCAYCLRVTTLPHGRTAAAIQVESEDSDESEEEEMPQNVRLTKRQAALAKARKGIAGSETSVDEEPEEEAAPPPPAKRRRGANSQVDPSELALRKEESARKRRNVSERKLQNEKAETINRLLKKQSRPRNKRTTALSTAPPAEIPTPPIETPGSGDENAAVALEDTVDLADAQFLLIPQETDPEPIMYRWISTSRAPDDADTVTDGDQPKVMRVSFAVPPSVLPPPSNSESEVMASDDGRTQVTAPAPLPAVCGVEGCTAGRRYRLVGGPWGTGACGMAHLKLLQAAS
ncbi:hypothetical protein FB45DRAFT_899121 [Roridomyces roridus]|uniref:INO80 complex subunit B-like conserved region domain-containing protein n=1 Tax=Roridomyces roridus TaxID=1738132 RepID=A0AAD7BBP6_9AGAR|nr:hypothetical protein FB45DRAFT_934162 [Roridomyces roridus]KAJ7644993.1 hypothetical protein FB45DRAFT_899121 [Roridomyces roridus]